MPGGTIFTPLNLGPTRKVCRKVEGEGRHKAGYVCSDPGAYTTSCCFDAATACNGTGHNCGSSCTSKHTPRMRPPSPAGRCRWLCAPAHPAAGSCRPAAPAPAPTQHPAAQCRGQSPRPWRLGRRVQAWVENDRAAAATAGGGGGAVGWWRRAGRPHLATAMSVRDESEWLQRQEADWQLSFAADRRGRASGSADDSRLRCREADAGRSIAPGPQTQHARGSRAAAARRCGALAGKSVLAAA